MGKTQPETPTLDRIQEIKDKSQAIGEFLEWLAQERGIVLAEDQRKAVWTCEECGEIPVQQVVHVSWTSTDEALWRHSVKFCARVKDMMAKRRSVPASEYRGGRVDHVPEGLYPARNASIDTLLHQFFDIDPVAEEREKRALLDFVRRSQG